MTGEMWEGIVIRSGKSIDDSAAKENQKAAHIYYI